jgi:iron complex transport system ATP-binding protein
MTEASPPILGAYGVGWRYGDRDVLSEVSFELERGTITALLGPNGSGKSTLLRRLAGLLIPRGEPDAGIVRIGGRPIDELSPPARARAVAYVPTDLRAEFPVTAREAVMMGRLSHGGGTRRAPGARDDERVDAAMKRCACAGLRDRALHTLSGGERQLVAMARALAQEARVLLLDETLSRMDLHHQARMGGTLRELAREGYALVWVSHDVNVALERADRVILLRAGRKLGDGAPGEVLTRENLAALYPGADLVLGANPVTGAPQIFFGRAGLAP